MDFRIRHWILAACIVALTMGSAEARSLAEIKARGTLRVGFAGDYAPYAIRDPKGGFIGYDVTMAHALARAFGVTLTIVPTTWKSLESDLASDRFDIAMGGVSITPARAAIGAFSQPVATDGKRPIARCADRERFTTIAAIDRPDVVVAVNIGGTNETFAKTHFPHAYLRRSPANLAIFDDLAAGRADVFVTDGAEVDFQARHHPGVLCPADVPHPFDRFEKAYLMNPDPALKSAVDAVVRKMLASGDYGKMEAQE